MSLEKDAIIAKYRKLLAMTRSPIKEEADTARQMAASYALRHNIKLRNNQIVEEEIIVKVPNSPISSWNPRTNQYEPLNGYSFVKVQNFAQMTEQEKYEEQMRLNEEHRRKVKEYQELEKAEMFAALKYLREEGVLDEDY